MYRVFVHSFLTGEGQRHPYRICPTGDPLKVIHEDDRIEDGYFITAEELRVIRADAFEAGRDSGDELSFEEFHATRQAETITNLHALREREAIRREAFKAGFCNETETPFGESLDAEEWEIAYESWKEQKLWGMK